MSSLRRSRHRFETCDARARTFGSSMNDSIWTVSTTQAWPGIVEIIMYPKTKLVRQAGERILLQQRADKLVNKAQLLAGAEIEHVGQDPRALRARAILKVLPQLGEEEVLIICSVAPVRLAMGRAWGGRRRRRRRWRPGELLVEVGSWRGHAWGRRPSNLPLLPGQLLEPRIHRGVGGVQGQVLGQNASSPLREAHGAVVASHGLGQRRTRPNGGPRRWAIKSGKGEA